MYEIQNLRVLSQIFSPSMFQSIIRKNDIELYKRRIEKHFKDKSTKTNEELIKKLYKSLQSKYRCEYIYKNSVINYIIENESLQNTLTLNEFKIGESKADLIMLNGKVRVYEIKTGLDSLNKLEKQIQDYYKFADEVYIVTDEKYGQKLIHEYEKSNIGIIIFDLNNESNTIKKATKKESVFNYDTIFKLLRKQEYLDLVNHNFGTIPDVPNTKIFRVCYELLSSLDLIKFQKQVLNKLKERKVLEIDFLNSSKTPVELKHICNTLNFNEIEYLRLYEFLSEKP